MQQLSRWTSKMSLAIKIQIKFIPIKNDFCINFIIFQVAHPFLKFHLQFFSNEKTIIVCSECVFLVINIILRCLSH